MKPIDGDALMNVFRDMNFGYMQHEDVIDCLQNAIDRQPEIKIREKKSYRCLISKEERTEEIAMAMYPDKTWSYVNLTTGYINITKWYTAEGILNYFKAMGYEVHLVE